MDIIKDIPSSMRQDVLATLLSMAYQDRIGFDYQDNVHNNYDSLFLSCGSMDKISVTDVIDFLVATAHIKKSDIGKIEIKRKTTFVDIKPQVSEKVLKHCQNKKIKQRKIKIEYASKK